MLSQQLLELAANLGPSIQTWPRRKPGMLMAGDRVIRYADLHSFYHQIRQIFGQRLYNFHCARPDPTILDCGAHVGLASFFFKERFPAARITAFEADAELADICAKDPSLGFDDVKTVAAAVWTHDQGVEFNHSSDDAGHVRDGLDGTGTRVPSVRLQALLADRVDLLKLDVEGAEFALFEDCGERLAHADHIVMEVHAMGSEQANIGALLRRLEDLDFRYVLGDLHQATWLSPKAPPPFEYCRTEKFIMTVFAWHRRVAASG